MNEKPDWEAIQREYETTSIPIRALANTYQVSRSTLADRSRGWGKRPEAGHRTPDRIFPDTGQKEMHPIHVLRPIPAPSPVNAVEIAKLGLKAVLKIMEKNDLEMILDLGELVKAANASTQFNKIIINAPSDSETEEEEEDLSVFDDDELRLYAELQERAKKRA